MSESSRIPVLNGELEELPSKFARENNFVYIGLRLLDPNHNLPITNITIYMDYFDQCFYQAREGNITAALHLSHFYRSLYFDNKATNIRSWDIAKRFALLAANGGQSSEYIHITGIDYGAGKDLKENTKWSVKHFTDHPGDFTSFMALSNHLDLKYLDKLTLRILRKFIAKNYSNVEVRMTLANMYLKGFFGRCEKLKARAFSIAYNEWRLLTKHGVNHIKAYRASFILYDFVADWFRNSKHFQTLAAQSNFLPATPEFDPDKFIRNQTRILEYYHFVPEYLRRELSTRKQHLRVDLHGLSLEESIERVMELAKILALNPRAKSALVITGRGNHSPDNIPILKPAIQDLLEKISRNDVFSLQYKKDQGDGAFIIWIVRSGIL